MQPTIRLYSDAGSTARAPRCGHKIVRQRQPRSAARSRRDRCHPTALAYGSRRGHTKARHILLERVAHLVGRDRDLAHADLVAVIERRRAAQRQQQHRRRRAPARRRSASRAAAGRDCRAPNSARRRRQAARSVRSAPRSTRVPRHVEQLKLNGRCRPDRSRAVVGHQLLDRQIDLADQQPLPGTRRPRRASRE